jgi:hypothetical protein
MCNKIGYKSKSEAKKEARLMSIQHRSRSKKSKMTSKKLRPYRCPNCKWWHLTSLARSVAKRFTNAR